MLATLPMSPSGVRDRALLLVGFAGAFRRSELVAIDHAHCAQHRDGVIITIPFSKTDQEGRAEEVGLPYGAHPETCPVRALTDWLAYAAITDGPIFRPITRHGHIAPTRLTDRGVALVIKRAVSAARDAAIERGNTALAESMDPTRYAGTASAPASSRARPRPACPKATLCARAGTNAATPSANTSATPRSSARTPPRRWASEPIPLRAARRSSPSL